MHIYEVRIAGRYYVGKTSHSDASVRKSQHFEHLKEGTHHNYLMLDLFNAGHEPRFRVIESLGVGSTYAELDALEKHYINEYAATFKGKCINLIGVGGELRAPQQKVHSPKATNQLDISGYEQDHAVQAGCDWMDFDFPFLPQDMDCCREGLANAYAAFGGSVPTFAEVYAAYRTVCCSNRYPPLDLKEFEQMLKCGFGLFVTAGLVYPMFSD